MKQRNADIERLFRQHYAEMFRVARGMLYDEDECKDVVSEVFAHLMAEPIMLLPDTEEAYLLRSVRNRCLNLIAHKDVRERVSKLLLADAETVLAEDDDERLEQLRRIIDGLEPPLRRRILQLRYLREMTYQEVAEELHVSKVTVYNHLSQAMDTIRDFFKRARR